jgi:hypothetical protein
MTRLWYRDKPIYVVSPWVLLCEVCVILVCQQHFRMDCHARSSLQP